jgi:hypothetical protein
MARGKLLRPVLIHTPGTFIMADYLLSIPETLYAKAREVAAQTARPVDEVLRARLEASFTENALDLSDDEQKELQALVYLADDTLWTIAREQMPLPKQSHMQLLMTKNSDGSITEAEYLDLAQLVDQGQRLMLRKAAAMKLLLDRGYQITLDNLKADS